ncbi:alpha/beta fold hydrolase [Kitasatospora sp. McL0602]|uniref:alpha/beta fold hydrolase n=1 Tax=Kitasatospora sp. McL0602 TaxID=3439530 RepID=UPI003F8890B8
MPTFSAPDGTELAYHLLGEGEPLLVVPGGPMVASAYLGDLGGLSEHRQLVLLDLRGTGDSATPADPATYRCDRQVDDVEALRAHLGLETADVIAHSAGGDLALLYAARYPQRLRTLTLVTARARAIGLQFTEEHRAQARALRAAEPWYPAAQAAMEAILADPDNATDEQWDAISPFHYGRWDTTAQEHARSTDDLGNDEAADLYPSEGAFDPAAAKAAVAALDARVLVLAGELDGAPRPSVAAETAALLPSAELFVQPGAGHYPWLDDPELFSSTVAAFLKG